MEVRKINIKRKRSKKKLLQLNDEQKLAIKNIDFAKSQKIEEMIHTL